MDQRIYGTVRPNGTMGIAALLMGRAGLIPTLERLGGLTVANSKGDQCISKRSRLKKLLDQGGRCSTSLLQEPQK